MFTLPSTFRGTPALGYLNHLAPRGVDATSVQRIISAVMCLDNMRREYTMNVRRFLVGALTMLCAATVSAQSRGAGPARPAPPAPRWPDGTINLGAAPGTSGLWDGAEPL